MTTRPPRRILNDGTRVYHNYHRYTPKPLEERTYAVRKPDDPRAVRFGGDWYLPLELVDDGQRAMPETRPDSDAYDHMPRPCKCDVCRRPAAVRWVRKWQRDHGLRPPPLRPAAASARGSRSR